MFWWLLIPVLLILGALAFLFNRLVAARQLAHNGWSDIEVQLKKRADLIPQLVTTVKGYAAHERDLFSEVAEQRGTALSAGSDVQARAVAEGRLAGGESRLFALAENYPDLKANQNFLDLQEALAETEESIEMARRFYNGAVRELNTKVQTFPGNLVAGAFNFDVRDYFETDVRAAPRVEFDT
jgi:LemA protein